MSEEQNYWIGFDLGGTKMLSAVYQDDLVQVGREKRRTKASEGPETVLNRILETLEKSIDDAKLTKDQISGIGIGVPGTIDLRKGVILEAPNLGWKDVPLRKIIEDKFNTKVVLCNDVDAGIYGEYSNGAAKGAYTAVGIFPGTGVGGGCVINGQILQGLNRTAMEIGHIPILAGGPLDGAANEGTVESMASRLAISAGAAQAVFRGVAPFLKQKAGTDLSDIRSGALADAIENGDKAVERVVRHAVGFLSRSIVTVIHLLAPDRIVLGGGLVEAMPDIFIGESAKYVSDHVLKSYKGTYEIVAAELGDDSSIIGAAAWIRNVVNG